MKPLEPKLIQAPVLPLRGKAFALIAAAGASTRFGGKKKEFEFLDGMTVLEHSIEPFISLCQSIFVICPREHRKEFEEFFERSSLARALRALPGDFHVVEGGSMRQESVRFGLLALAARAGQGDLVLIHDGSRPWISQNLIQSTLESARTHGASLPLMPLIETPKMIDGEFICAHPNRLMVMTAQTPQIFSFPEILEAHELAAKEKFLSTDDAMIWDHFIGPVAWVKGESQNRKITFKDDLMKEREYRTGIGYDIHPLVEGKPLLIAGVAIESSYGESGYSDGDVLWHAIIDAALGAAALGDIGTYFPPGEARWKNADSTELAKTALSLIFAQGWKFSNIDCTVLCEAPKLAPYRDKIQKSIAAVLNLPLEAVSFKAKTKEGFDATGRRESIEAHATVLLMR